MIYNLPDEGHEWVDDGEDDYHQAKHRMRIITEYEYNCSGVGIF